MKQQTDEWRKLRKNKIGASDAPIIMGVSPFVRQDGLPKTPLTLWKEKLDLLPEEKPTYSMQYGIEEEEKARQIFKDKTGIEVVPKVVFHSDISYMMASLDGFSEKKNTCVEIKHANEKDHEMVAEGKIPEKYFPQLQHQMDCADIKQMYYLSRHKDDVQLIEVGVDEEYLKELHDKEKKFWECMINFTEPSLIDKDYRERDEEWYKVALRLKELKKMKKEIGDLEKLQEEELKKLSKGENSFFGDLKYFSYTRKGAINYGKIPELEGVNLESYRKTSSTIWKLTS